MYYQLPISDDADFFSYWSNCTSESSEKTGLDEEWRRVFISCGIPGKSTCIPVDWVCDGTVDCPNAADESRSTCSNGKVVLNDNINNQ